MSLERDIKQDKGFKSERQKAIVNILYTHNWVSTQMKGLLKKYDLTPQQYNVLRILRGQFPAPISTLNIRDRMIDHMSDVSRIVVRLCKKELVMSSTCSQDKRKVDVTISDKGLALLAKIDSSEGDFECIFESISEDDAKLLNTVLDRLRHKGLRV